MLRKLGRLAEILNNTTAMNRTILFLFVLSVLCSCEKQKFYSSNLIGEWAWQSTCGGYSGQCSTPETTNLTVKLFYSADSVYYEYKNDTLISSYPFHIKTQINNAGGVIKFIQFDNRTQTYSINGDTLSLSYIGADFSSNYKRIK
jgi:hypothetical protein